MFWLDFLEVFYDRAGRGRPIQPILNPLTLNSIKGYFVRPKCIDGRKQHGMATPYHVVWTAAILGTPSIKQESIKFRDQWYIKYHHIKPIGPRRISDKCSKSFAAFIYLLKMLLTVKAGLRTFPIENQAARTSETCPNNSNGRVYPLINSENYTHQVNH